MKEIDLRKSVYQLTEEHPELIDILKELGFAGIAFPAVRKTLGRKITLPEGSRKQNKDLDQVIRHLEGYGFTVTGKEEAEDRLKNAE